MFTFETSALTYGERVLSRIQDNMIRLLLIAKVLVLSFIFLYFGWVQVCLAFFILFLLLLLPYFIWSRVYITQWKAENGNVVITYRNFNTEKTIHIPKTDLAVDVETAGNGVSVAKMILTHKSRAQTLLVQPEIGKWFVENMKKLKEEYP